MDKSIFLESVASGRLLGAPDPSPLICGSHWLSIPASDLTNGGSVSKASNLGYLHCG
jgi:hypothetical protein